MGWAKALYIDSLYAQEEQERRKAGMAVNSGSLMLKRCREAQKMHGNDTPIDAPALPVRMGKKVLTTVQDGFGGRPGSSGLGASNGGNDKATREGQSGNSGTAGQQWNRHDQCIALQFVSFCFRKVGWSNSQEGSGYGCGCGCFCNNKS